MKTDNTGQIVVVSLSKLWNRLYQHMVRVYPTEVLKVDFVDTYEQAITLLNPSPLTEKKDTNPHS